MREKRSNGWYVLFKPLDKPPVMLGGPYSKETAILKEEQLIKDYQVIAARVRSVRQ